MTAFGRHRAHDLRQLAADLDHGRAEFYEGAQRFESIRADMARALDQLSQAQIQAVPDRADWIDAYADAQRAIEASLRRTAGAVSARLAG